MRIAVCLSGQSRTWKTAHKNILRFFDYSKSNEDVQVDYFIHTWHNNSWREKKAKQWNTWDVPADDVHEISSVYNPKYFEVETFNKEKFPNAWDGLFYSFMKSMHHKRLYEVKNNFKYDVVVKSRLDVIFQPDTFFNFFNIKPLIAYTTTPISKFPREFNGNNFSDVMFYGDSNTMDILGNTYRYSKLKYSETHKQHIQASGLIDYFSFYGPGVTLYEYMTQHGIYPTCNDRYQYAVVRNDCEGLDSIDDADKIFKIGYEWYQLETGLELGGV